MFTQHTPGAKNHVQPPLGEGLVTARGGDDDDSLLKGGLGGQRGRNFFGMWWNPKLWPLDARAHTLTL